MELSAARSIIEGRDQQHQPVAEGSDATKNSFPVQLHYLLGEMESDGMDDIISFSVHGRAFRVHNVDRFVEEILPQ
jgi:hypothetical protein